MAEEMKQENWIKTAIPDKDTKSIYATVLEGYQYQVYYDEQTGELSVYPIGKDDGHSIPKLKISYDNVKATIHVEASCEDEIALIEVTHKGEIVGSKENSGIADFNVQKTGWYEVKAVCKNGKEAYGKIKRASSVKTPNIEVTSNNEKENDWYGKDNKEVEVTISTDNETAVGIYYKTNKDIEYTYQEGRSKVITIKEVGRTIIYAYVVDKQGNESEIGNKTIQYDNIKPVIDLNKVEVKEGAPEEGKEWCKTNAVLSLAKAITDQPQEVGIDGYYAWEIASKDKTEEPTEGNYLKGIDKDIRVETDGIHLIAFQAKDKAGNLSEQGTITVKKDSTKPKGFTPTVKDITDEGFTIVAGTSDDTSGMAEYSFYVGGELKGTIKEEENDKVAECKITGLEAKKSYIIKVIAKDKAGNITEGTGITPVTTKETEIANDKAESMLAEIFIGDYVAYQPNTESSAIYSTTQTGLTQTSIGMSTTTTERSGAGNQTISRDTTLNWRVLSIDSNKLTLISATISREKLKLSHANGYNNGVKLLNDICNDLYRNSELGAVGRNLNENDVDRLIGLSKAKKKTLSSEYDKEYSSTYTNFPTIFLNDELGAPNGNFDGTLDRSNQEIWYEGESTSDNIRGLLNTTNTNLNEYLSEKNPSWDVLFANSKDYRSTEGTVNTILATRNLSAQWGQLKGGLRMLQSAYSSIATMGIGYSAFYSNAQTHDASGTIEGHIRPVVEIPISSQLLIAGGSGTLVDPYVVQLKK